jgi:hypothetical protein
MRYLIAAAVLSLVGSAFAEGERGFECIEQAKYTFADEAGLDWFGGPIAVSGDHAVVSAQDSVLFLHRVDGDWVLNQVIPAGVVSDPGMPAANFGSALAISGDLAVVAAASYSYGTTMNAGAVLIYKFSDGDWGHSATIVGPWGAHSYFGSSVVVHGQHIAILHSRNATNGGERVFSFYREDASGDWVEDYSIVGPECGPAAGSAIAADGNLVISSYVSYSGSCEPHWLYVYHWEAASESWILERQIELPPPCQGQGGQPQLNMGGDFFTVSCPWRVCGPGSGIDVYQRTADDWELVFEFPDGWTPNNISILGNNFFMFTPDGSIDHYEWNGTDMGHVRTITAWDDPNGNFDDYPFSVSSQELLVTDRGGVETAGAIYQFPTIDCNENGTADDCDVIEQNSYDCNQNLIPDECESDCDGDGLIDDCDTDPDIDGDGIPDNCEEDCNGNTIPDGFEIKMGWAPDCDGDLVIDECAIADGSAADCDSSGVPDSCEIADGSANDCDGDGIIDECAIDDGSVADCDESGVPDSCQIADGSANDCDGDGAIDECSIADGSVPDCNANSIPDSCDITDEVSCDADSSGVPDECELGDCPADVGGDGVVDVNDLLAILGYWGQAGPGGDVDASCLVDVNDILTVIGNWGPCP